MGMKHLTEADIRALASDRSYERGDSYFRGGAVEDVVRRGNIVTAEVAGSGYEAYVVQIVFNDAGKAKYYDTAVSWVQRARDIYWQHDRQAEWYAYLDALVDKHARKYKLVPMLRDIR